MDRGYGDTKLQMSKGLLLPPYTRYVKYHLLKFLYLLLILMTLSLALTKSMNWSAISSKPVVHSQNFAEGLQSSWPRYFVWRIFHSPEQTDTTYRQWDSPLYMCSTSTFTAGKPQQLDAEQFSRPAERDTTVSHTRSQRSVFSSDGTSPLLNRTYTLRRYWGHIGFIFSTPQK
jgi:hypothetical protein